MTTITNTSVNRHVTNAEIKQWFADETIDITGTKLSIKRDEDGRIMKVILDKDISDLQVSLFKAKFFYKESIVEEIGRVELTENVNDFSVNVSKNKKHIQMTIHTLIDGALTKGYRIFFNETSLSLPKKYHQDHAGIVQSLHIPLRTRNDFVLLNVFNLQSQIKQGAFHASSYFYNADFRWNNTTDYINYFHFDTRFDNSYFKAGTSVVVHGWN